MGVCYETEKVANICEALILVSNVMREIRRDSHLASDGRFNPSVLAWPSEHPTL